MYILLVTVIVGVLVLLGNAAEGVKVVVVVEEGVEGAERAKVMARDDVEELKLHKRIVVITPQDSPSLLSSSSSLCEGIS